MQSRKGDIQGPRVDLGVWVEKQHGVRFTVAQDDVIGGREPNIAAPYQPHSGKFALDHIRGRIGTAAIDHGYPRSAVRWVRLKGTQAAPQQIFGTMADDYDFKVQLSRQL
jgi:hypothetical protein